MEYQINGNPDQGDLTVALGTGESILAEAGAMSRMSGHLQVEARMLGGMLSAVARKFAGGESLMISHYTAPTPGRVSFAPTYPGTICVEQLTGGPINLTAGSFLACTPGIELSTRFGGLKALFSGEGAFLIQASGQGTLFFNAYGAVVEKDVQGAITVDTSHVVAWEPSLDYEIRGMGGIKQTLLSGEGLVMHFQGAGKLYLQTRHMGGIVRWLTPWCR